MPCVRKFEPVHKRVLGYFGYTLLEAQSLPEHEKQELQDRVQDAFGGLADEPAELFGEDGLVRDEEWLALDDLSEMIFWPPPRRCA
ncbi:MULTISPECIES: hypothetical protein [unclassified Adlercreutzia]|uniref:hypothetical protein n=1 Tax=unclassified Adlercreutzia TaxID=2636013 RepID=UPI0013EC2AF6|nr:MULTISPECIES: hypothetical protein [unclassified Adlercreutzia]